MRATLSSSMGDLESQLQQSLRKVVPNQEFIEHLHTRLTTPETTSIEKRQSLGLGLFVVAASLLSGILVFWLIKLMRTGETS